MGDFNLPNVHWFNDDDDNEMLIPTNFPNTLPSNVLLNIQSEGLFQINDLINKTGNILDLFFINEPNVAALRPENCPISQPIDEAQPPFKVQMELECNFLTHSSNNNLIFSFKNANFDRICDYLHIWN